MLTPMDVQEIGFEFIDMGLLIIIIALLMRRRR